MISLDRAGVSRRIRLKSWCVPAAAEIKLRPNSISASNGRGRDGGPMQGHVTDLVLVELAILVLLLALLLEGDDHETDEDVHHEEGDDDDKDDVEDGHPLAPHRD